MDQTRSTQDRDLRRIMIYGSSVGTGIAAASLEALKPNFAFVVSPSTFAVGLLVTAGFVGYWKLMFAAKQGRAWNWLRVATTAIVAALGITGFLYPVRFVAPDRFPELAGGLARAAIGLAFGAAMLLACKRFFDADVRSNTYGDQTNPTEQI
jgi:cytochrome c biogenesis protein CcdA